MISKEHKDRNISGIPVLKGLVLAGGKSSRMGRDKTSIDYHGKEQRYHVVELLRPFCDEVFISCREDQRDSIDGYKIIPDAYTNAGPLGALLSAFEIDHTCAWLTVACDLPLLDGKTLALLISQRDADSMATTFESPHDGLPEPLITIWEPKAYEALSAFWEKEQRCPRKALLNNKVKMIKPLNGVTLMNVNTPQDFEMAQQLLHHKKLDHAE